MEKRTNANDHNEGANAKSEHAELSVHEDEALTTKPTQTTEPSGQPAVTQPTAPSTEDIQKEMLYLRAEYENYRKRMIREQEQAIRFGNERLIAELTTVYDMLEMALSQGKTLREEQSPKNIKAFIAGIELTLHEFIQLLNRFGVEFIGKAGEKFDPSRHEAVLEKPSSQHESGTVVEILQRGSLLHGRLLKPARVVVAQ